MIEDYFYNHEPTNIVLLSIKRKEVMKEKLASSSTQKKDETKSFFSGKRCTRRTETKR